jgi:class 3 adenylate cyclase
MVDCSGFTALADRLTADGTRGIEALGLRLNATMQEIVEVLLGHGGDIVAFAGDALTVVWTDPDGPDGETDMAAILACAEHMHELAIADPDGLALRIAVTRGSFTWSCLGGVHGRPEWVFSGEVVTELGCLLMATVPGETALSPTLGAGATAPRFATMPAPSAARPGVILRSRLAQEFSPSTLVHLAQHLPAALQSNEHLSHESWFSEIRTVTSMFLSLGELEGPHELARAQELVVALQECVARQGGTLDKLAIDDKGLSALAVWGVPPLIHADGPIRAIRAHGPSRNASPSSEVPWHAASQPGESTAGTWGIRKGATSPCWAIPSIWRPA